MELVGLLITPLKFSFWGHKFVLLSLPHQSLDMMRPRDIAPTLPDHDPLSSTEDLNNPLPSPPYRPFATSSQVALDYNYNSEEDSPAYRSIVNLGLMADYNAEMALADDKSSAYIDSGRPGDEDVQAAQPKPTVHYPTNVPLKEGLAYQKTPNMPHIESRASSIVSGDELDEDEVEDYDWSAEDDLEDPQFEKQMGAKTKPHGWGPKRRVRYLISVLAVKFML